MTLAWSLAALGTAYLIALVVWPFLGLSSGKRLVAVALLAAAVALPPWMVPAHAPVARLAVAIYAGVLMLKLWDLHVGVERGSRPDLRQMLAFMANPMSLVYRRRREGSGRGGWAAAVRLARAVLVMVVAAWLLTRLAGVDWSAVPFLVEHAAKGTTFFVFATAFFDALAAGVLLLGGVVTDPLDQPFLARTPAEFWRRYNRTIGEFLREDVFRVARGRRRPIRATLIAFAVSGLLHEYLFTVATGEVQGYQTAFFLLHGGAVVLTLRARPSRVVGIPATFAFNVVSSVLFFASFHSMGGFYSEGLPPWLWTT